MATATRNTFTTWATKNTAIKQLLKQSRCQLAFSVCMSSCSSGIPKYSDLQTAQSSNISCFRSLFGTSKASSMDSRECLNTNWKHLISRKMLEKRWISTSCVCLNEDTSSISSGKRKLKERIEKVKEMVHRESILTIPNLLSTFRIVAAPFLGYFIITNQFTIAVALFGIAGITDMLDGYIARNFKNQKSVFGTILDPVADKVLMSVLAVALTVADLLPVPLAVVILSRDFLLILAAFYFRYKSLPPPKTLSRYFDVNLATVELRPNLLGKANTVLQLGLVGSTLVAPVLGYVDHQFLHVLWYLVGTSTVLSSVSYLFSANTAVRYLK